VDGLESDVQGQADVLRLDFFSDVGREAASRYGVKVLPTLLVFDGQGQVILEQRGMIDAPAVRAAIARLAED
jgi:thioredoxin-related protein